MFSILGRYKEVLWVGLLLLHPLVTLLSQGQKGQPQRFVDRVILGVASPIQSTLTALIQGSRDTVDTYFALRGAREEARECEAKLSASQAELNASKEALLENLRLKQMLGYVEASVEQELAARVVGLNPSPQFLSVRLNRGEDDGVRSGMPAVTPEGVVGQVVRATGGTADVMLLSDPASRIAVVVQRTRVRGTAVGKGGGLPLVLENVLRTDDLTEGDIILTAGTDGIFPKGLVVGSVDLVVRNATGMFLRANLRAAVDPRRVEEVLVVPTHAGASPSALREGGAKAP